MKLMNENEYSYYKPSVEDIIKTLGNGEELYTFQLRKCRNMKGESDSKLRQLLRTMESKGLIINIDLGTNIHKWKLA